MKKSTAARAAGESVPAAGDLTLIDTHVHLDDQAFAPDRAAVLARARAAGVRWLVNAGSTAEANRQALLIAGADPDVYAGIGLHPHEFPKPRAEAVADLPALLCQDRVVAVGEIGLDYHLFPDFPAPDREAQQAAFAAQLRLARIFELPVLLHVREAYADALRLLREQPLARGGIMHCYSGGTEHLEAVLELGLTIGFGGTSTYPKAEDVRAAARAVPEDRLVLETDAPYLPPQSRRGQRNEPAYLAETLAAVAAARGQAPAEVARFTRRNAQRLLRIGDGDPGTLVYPIRDHLYVNLTNRCSAHCVFCPRQRDRRLHGVDLTLQREAAPAEILKAIGDPTRYREIVFCGFGEPVLRWPALIAVGEQVKRLGGKVRVNTNGQADVIFGRDILPEGRRAVDAWSVSLNAPNAEQYARLMQPAAGASAFSAVTSFIRRAAAAGFEVAVTAVELPEVDIRAVAELARGLGGRYRGRISQRLGEPES